MAVSKQSGNVSIPSLNGLEQARLVREVMRPLLKRLPPELRLQILLQVCDTGRCLPFDIPDSFMAPDDVWTFYLSPEHIGYTIASEAHETLFRCNEFFFLNLAEFPWSIDHRNHAYCADPFLHLRRITLLHPECSFNDANSRVLSHEAYEDTYAKKRKPLLDTLLSMPRLKEVKILLRQSFAGMLELRDVSPIVRELKAKGIKTEVGAPFRERLNRRAQWHEIGESSTNFWDPDWPRVPRLPWPAVDSDGEVIPVMNYFDEPDKEDMDRLNAVSSPLDVTLQFHIAGLTDSDDSIDFDWNRTLRPSWWENRAAAPVLEWMPCWYRVRLDEHYQVYLKRKTKSVSTLTC